MNVESALQSATPNYGVSGDELCTTISWLLRKVGEISPAIAAATLSVAERYGAAYPDDLATLRHRAPEDPAAAIVHLDATLADLLKLTDTITAGGNP